MRRKETNENTDTNKVSVTRTEEKRREPCQTRPRKCRGTWIRKLIRVNTQQICTRNPSPPTHHKYPISRSLALHVHSTVYTFGSTSYLFPRGQVNRTDARFISIFLKRLNSLISFELFPVYAPPCAAGRGSVGRGARRGAGGVAGQ